MALVSAASARRGLVRCESNSDERVLEHTEDVADLEAQVVRSEMATPPFEGIRRLFTPVLLELAPEGRARPAARVPENPDRWVRESCLHVAYEHLGATRAQGPVAAGTDALPTRGDRDQSGAVQR